MRACEYVNRKWTMRKKCTQNEKKENEANGYRRMVKQENFSGRERKDGKVEWSMRILTKT